MTNKIEVINNPSGINLEYDEVSPITGNKCVIVEADEQSGDEHRMCMESGYVTRTSLVIDTEACTQYEQGCTELMKKLQVLDPTTNTVWYPTFMQMPGGMLYCEGNGITPDDYQWCIAKVIPVMGDERKKYPIPGKEGEYFTSRLDVENAQKYPGNMFEKALDIFYQLIQEQENEN